MLLHLPRDALQRDTFEVGIALLTDASSSANDGVESAYWIECACMPHPYYVMLRHAHGLDSKFAELFQRNLQKLPFMKI